jgi:hypothetical protein
MATNDEGMALVILGIGIYFYTQLSDLELNFTIPKRNR